MVVSIYQSVGEKAEDAPFILIELTRRAWRAQPQRRPTKFVALGRLEL